MHYQRRRFASRRSPAGLEATAKRREINRRRAARADTVLDDLCSRLHARSQPQISIESSYSTHTDHSPPAPMNRPFPRAAVPLSRAGNSDESRSSDARRVKDGVGFLQSSPLPTSQGDMGERCKLPSGVRGESTFACFLISQKSSAGWLSSRVVSVLDSGAAGPGFKSQPRRCRVTVLGKLFTPIVPLCTE